MKGVLISSKFKAIQSGKIIEIIEYENPIYRGYESNGGRIKGQESINKEKNREDTLYRARKTVRRLINSNVNAYGVECKPKFVTLTFKDHIIDFDVANYEYTKFIQRLNYNIFGQKKSILKYTVVPEFTKRGRIHFHVVFYNLPYTKSSLVEEIWGNGFIKINKIDQVDNIGAYICKYMVKELDDKRLEGKKCYFNSRGLYQPIELVNENEVKKLADSLPQDKIKYSNSFDSEHLGKIHYVQYNLN